MDREQLLQKYLQFTFAEYLKSLQELNIEEQIHFTDTLINLCRIIFSSEPETNDTDQLIETELLVKYRTKMKYFAHNQVWDYFYNDTLGFSRFLSKMQLPADTLALSYEEHTDHLLNLVYTFTQLKIKLYVADPDSSGLSKKDHSEDLNIDPPQLSKRGKIYTTRWQQVLLFHYLSKALEIRVRRDIPISNLAKFYNGLFGWEYTDINNSTLYKLLKKDPLKRHNKKELLQQLYWVKEQFLLIGLTDIVAKIEEAIKTTEAELH